MEFKKSPEGGAWCPAVCCMIASQQMRRVVCIVPFEALCWPDVVLCACACNATECWEFKATALYDFEASIPDVQNPSSSTAWHGTAQYSI